MSQECKFPWEMQNLLEVARTTESFALRWLDPVFFGGVQSYFEALCYPHVYFYRKSSTWNG